MIAEATTLERSRSQMFGPGFSARVLQGEEVDAEVEEIQMEVPTVSRKVLRQHSYATIFYEQVRCKLVHEGELSGSAASFPHTIRRDARISYVNATVACIGGEVTDYERGRRIYFHMPWLIELTRAMARNADKAAPNGGLARPAAWWIDG